MTIDSGLAVRDAVKRRLATIKTPIAPEAIPGVVVQLLELIQAQPREYQVPATADVFGWMVEQFASSADEYKPSYRVLAHGVAGGLYAAVALS
jgi:hypothetical protein